MAGSFWMEKYWPDYFWLPPYWFGPDWTWPITVPWRLDPRQDITVTLAAEDMDGWEGVETWHVQLGADPATVEQVAERKFPLGGLMSGETTDFGRRIQSVTTHARAPGPDGGALVKVYWKDITVYSAT